MSSTRKTASTRSSAQPEANAARNGAANQPLTKTTKAELIKESTSKIKTKDDALRFLRSKEVLLEGEEVTVSALSMALLYLVRGTIVVPAVLLDGMRAVAICLGGLGEETAARVTVTESREAIEGFLGDAKKVMEGLVTEATQAMKAMQAEVAKGAAERAATAQVAQTQKDSYAAALMFGSQGTAQPSREGRAHHELMAREEMRSRQVLVDGIEGVREATAGLTPKMIVEKANMALEAMEAGEWAVDTRPLEAKFITAKVLANKGVVLEMETLEAAEWIRGVEARKSFEQSFGGSAVIRDRLYQLVVEFVPASLKEVLPSARGYVERDNALDLGTILAMRWLRDTKHWKEAQRAGHAVVTLRNRDVSNNVIQKGLVMEGQHLDVRKLEEDPKRCYNCQLVNAGHIAAQCPNKKVVCPNCAGAHAGGECKAPRAAFRCASCVKEGLEHHHAAWDRNCPVFLQEKRRLRERHPENNYKYFPTKEVWTWERHEEVEQLGEHQRMKGPVVGMGREGRRQQIEARRPDAGWKGPLGTALPGAAQRLRVNSEGLSSQPARSQPVGSMLPPNSQPAATNAGGSAAGTSRPRLSVSRGRGGMNGGRTASTSQSRVQQAMVDDFFKGAGLSQTGPNPGGTQGSAPSQ